MRWFILGSLLLVLTVSPAQIKIRGTYLLEFQNGNLPEQNPDNRSVYDRLDLKLRSGKLGLSTRIETFHTSLHEQDYARISQLKASYKTKRLELEVGNLFPSLGRGMLFRTYEIPGSVWEDLAFRERYAFYRDLRGASAKIKLGDFQLKALYGEVLNVGLPPSIEDRKERRPDLISAVQADYKIQKQKIGVMALLREDQIPTSDDRDDAYLGVYMDINLLNKINLYGEWGRQQIRENDSEIQSSSPGKALYLSGNVTFGKLGITAEYKDYENMTIGAGISDPPTLVKEHSSRLLNRSTHVPNVNDESGYQVEVYYSFESGDFVSFNTSKARNTIREGFVPQWREYFIEYQMNGEKLQNRFFLDYAKDPRIFENTRYGFGYTADYSHGKRLSTLEVEMQQITRFEEEFWNTYVSYTFKASSKVSLSAILETSRDPFILEADKSTNIYPSIVSAIRPDNKNMFSLFVGERRGGPACNSGICYNVLDFKGAELRYLKRF